MIRIRWGWVCIALVSFLLAACGGGGGSSSSSPPVSSGSSSSASSASSSSSSAVALKSLVTTLNFPIGMAVSGPGESGNFLANAQEKALITATFNSIVAGNIMKMSYLEPSQGVFDYSNADQLVTYVQSNPGMVLHGHTLIWHSAYQVPAYITNFAGTPSEFNTALMNHVTQVATHFAGKVVSWDVVNEAIDDTNPAQWRPSVFYTKSGNSSVFIENAFNAAHAADPGADLYYNDYNIEWSSVKLNFLLAMVADFKNRGIPIHGIGFQTHVGLTFPDIATIKASYQAAAATGLKVRISELDVSVNGNNTMTSLDTTTAAAQKQRYHDIVKAYLDAVPPAQRGGITIWGTTDGESWINQPGHPDWPLLFNNDYSPKPAYFGVADALQGM